MPSPSLVRARRTAAAFAVAVAMAACGGDEAVTTAAGSADASATASTDAGPQAAADANIELLQAADDVRDIEVLDVGDGSISTLRAAVDGDRPVLLWFFSPH